MLIKIFFVASFLILSLIAVIINESSFVRAVQPFNVDIDLPATYKEVSSGTEIWFTIKLLNLANSKRVDVTLNYELINKDNVSIVHNSKTVAIETQASFVANLALPANAAPGDYYVHVTVSSPAGESTARASFKVIEKMNVMIFYYAGAGVLVLVLLIILLVKSGPLIEKMKLKMKIRRIVREKLKNK